MTIGRESLRRRYMIEKENSGNEASDEEKSLKIHYTQLDSFHKAISPVLLITQCLSLMPVVGIRNPNPFHLKFRVKSKAMIPAFLFLFFGSFFALFYIKDIFRQGLTAKNLVGIIFYLCGVSVSVLFLFLARNWPALMRTWFDTEIIFLQAPYKPLKRRLSTKIRTAAALIITSAIVENMLFFTSDIYNELQFRKVCNATGSYSMSDYFRHHFGFIFVIIPYNLPFGIGSMVVNFLFTFMWNYMDLFIVMVSLGLSSRFQQINHRIEALAGREVSEATWMEIRHHFVLLCELLEAVDETMSGIILLSSINNLYFICYQLLNILQKLRYTINYVYFWYSLLYLASRTTGVFLHAASINDEAAKPLKILRAVPSRNWCSEIERFTDQITTQRVALSGMKFFYLTRKLFFGMAGTIVTYELVLLQFDDPNPNLKPLCG